MKVMVGLVIGLSIGTWVGADIVHREYYPILQSQAHEIESLLNTREEEIVKVKETLELCRTEYLKQHKNGRDFITNALGIEIINVSGTTIIKEK